jgi:hypothetical protein
LCGNAFSPANVPTVSIVEGVLYGGSAVEKAICTIPPYVESHNAESKLSLYYQTSGSTFITVINKEID